MLYLNILYFIAQCIIVAIILLGLFRVRHIFGLSLLLTTLGVFQYMQIFLANTLYFKLAPGFIISSGSSVLFTGSLFVILLIYIREDALEARKIIYAILAANIVLTILQFTLNAGLTTEEFKNNYSLPKIFFSQNIKVTIVGTTLLFLDTFFIIFIYEVVSKYTKYLYVRMVTSMLIILSLDAIIFGAIIFYDNENVQQIIISNLISKNIASLIYAALFTIYIQYFEKNKLIIDSNKDKYKDLFHSLTFRQKYEKIYTENELQKEALKNSIIRYKQFAEQTSEGFYKITAKKPIPINLPTDEIIELIYKHMYVEECSELFAKLFDYNKADDLIGFSFFELHKKKYTQENIKTLTKFINSNFKIVDNESARINKQGEKLYFLNNANGIIKNGKLIAFWGTQRDITTKKKIEISLQEATKIINKSPAVAFLWRNDTTWSVEYVSTNIKILSGYTAEEFLNNEINFFNIVHKDDIKRVTKEVESYSKNINTQNFSHKPYRIITKNNEIKWVKDNSYIRRDEKGNITFFEGMLYDITEQQTTQITLQKERELFKALIDNIPVMLTLYEPSFNMLFLNNEFEIKTGYTIKNLKGDNILEKIYPNNEIRKQAIEFMNTETTSWKEFEITAQSGDVFITEWRNITLKNGIQIGIGLDITERKLAERKLLEEKTKAQQYLNVAGIILLSINKQGIVTLINPKGCEVLEYSKDEIIGKNWFDNFIPNKELIKIKSIAKQVFNGQLDNASYYENNIITKSGEQKIIAWHNEVLKNENNEIIGILSSGEDITERKKIEQELKLYNNHLQILHKLDLAILAAKPINKTVENVLHQLNKIIPFKMATLAHYNPKEKQFTRIKSITTFADVNINDEPIPSAYYKLINLKLLEKGQTQVISNIKKEFESIKEDSYINHKNINSTLIIPLISEHKLIGTLNLAAENINIFSVEKIKIAQEIATQLAISLLQNKLKEDLILYTQNLENTVKERTAQLEFSNSELRDFAQIVSHDLKAPLRAISQLSFWISQDYSNVLDDTGKDHLQMLIGRVKRMDNLIDGILQYSKVGKSKEKEIDINLQTTVEEVIVSLDPPENIEIIFNNKLPNILADPTRIEQLFQNLINNSIKFIDKPKGIITIGYTEDENYYTFYVSDNGPGIEEKYFEKIFQIFQRLESRDNQEGTGVGLSLVKRIIQIYGGEVWIKSKLYEGSTFYFTLPKKIVLLTS